MSTLSPFTIDVYVVTLERTLVERRREAAQQRLLSEAPRAPRPPKAQPRPRRQRRGRLAGVH